MGDWASLEVPRCLNSHSWDGWAHLDSCPSPCGLSSRVGGFLHGAQGAKSKCFQRQEVEAAVSKGPSLGTSKPSFYHIVFIKAVTEHPGSRKRTRYPTAPWEDVKESMAIFNLPKYYYYYYYSISIYYSSRVRNMKREYWYEDPPIALAEGASP